MEWLPTPGMTWSPSAYFFVATPSTSMFDTVLQRLQLIQEAGLHTSMEKSVAAVSAALSGVYALDSQGQNRLAAQEMMIFIESKLRKNALGDANELLAEVDVAKLSSRSMIGLIRSTFRLKKQLPAWEKAYSKSWRQVRKLGKSPEALFVGLPSAEGVEVAAAAK